MPVKLDSRVRIDEPFNLDTVKYIHYFAKDTLDKIFRHIDRMKIKDTGALRQSVKAVVHANAKGQTALVQIFYLYYGECVEQAVGRYWGVDSDLPKRTGLKSENVGAPAISQSGYGAMEGIIKGVPDRVVGGKRRGQYHRPRPYLRSEIRRQASRTAMKLMSHAAQLIEVRMIRDMEGLTGLSVRNALDMQFGGTRTMTYEMTDTGVEGYKSPKK